MDGVRVPGPLEGWLDDVQLRGVKLGLDNIRTALARVGNPQKRFPSILVGGTNGKGSTVAFATQLLGSAGLRVGSTVSPHLMHYRERFRIDGVIAAESRLDRLTTELRPLIDCSDGVPGITYFELGILLALRYFQDEGVDAAVVEVGLGGEFDASRGCDPAVAALVSVGRDHQHILGSDLPTIARTKARIAPPGGVLVTAVHQSDCLEVIAEEAKAVGCQLWRLGREFEAQRTDSGFSYQGPRLSVRDVPLGPAGDHQAGNAACALAAVEALATVRGTPLPTDQGVTEALASTQVAGRLELVPGEPGPQFLLDGAHNPEAAHCLAQELGRRPRPERRVLLLAAMREKVREPMLEALLPHVDQVWCTSGLTSDRFEAPGVLAEAVRARADSPPVVVTADNAREAVQRLRDELDDSAEVVVAGSLYLVGDVRRELGLPAA